MVMMISKLEIKMTKRLYQKEQQGEVQLLSTMMLMLLKDQAQRK
jgi:hypothetical protein